MSITSFFRGLLASTPIFDSGSSLGYVKLTNQIVSGVSIECKPFKKSHNEQLKWVSSYDWINFEKLKDIKLEIYRVFEGAGEYLAEDYVLKMD